MSYLLAKESWNVLGRSLAFSGLTLSYSAGTRVGAASVGLTEVVILGPCVDAEGEFSSEDLADVIATSYRTWEEVLSFSKRLCGSYVILHSHNGTVRALNDPAGYGGVYYHQRVNATASSEKFLALYLGINETSQDSEVIHGCSSDPSQPMPNDITMFDEIRILLPNHYLNLNTRKSTRFFPGNEAKATVSPEEAAEQTRALALEILGGFRSIYSLACPLSAGWDSRLNYALLRVNDDEPTCYTFIHDNFSEATADRVVPKIIVKSHGGHHSELPDLQAPQGWHQHVAQNFTPYPNPMAVNLAYTYRSSFDGFAFLSGDVLDQIGKSLLGQTLPEVFARPSFFACKSHNFSAQNRRHIEDWCDGVTSAGSISRFDLFSLENRLGRWAHQSNLVLQALGVMALNVYNCRQLIEIWLAVDRADRAHKRIHKALFETMCPTLIEIPFNPGSSPDWVKTNAPAFLLATYGKFYLQKTSAAFRVT